MVEKNELFEELMIVIMDIELNLTEFGDVARQGPPIAVINVTPRVVLLPSNPSLHSPGFAEIFIQLLGLRPPQLYIILPNRLKELIPAGRQSLALGGNPVEPSVGRQRLLPGGRMLVATYGLHFLLGSKAFLKLLLIRYVCYKEMDQDSTHMMVASKVPMLKPENGNAPLITKVVECVETTIAPTTAEEKAQGDAKSLPQAIEKSSTNGAVNTAHDATTTSTLATAINSTTIDNLSDAVVADSYANNKGNEILEEHWKELNQEKKVQLTLCTHGFIFYNSNSVVSTDSNYSSSCLENVKILKEQNEQPLKDLRTSKLNAIAYKTGLESIEARLLVYKKNESVYEKDIKLTVENFENSSKSLSKLIDCQIVDKCKTGLGYNAIPPPYTGNFMPPKPNLSFSGLEEFVNEPIVSQPIVETSEAKASADKPKVVRKKFGPPLTED
ncbi:hypothetical protein Tco_1182660 [Tanacetum coccineum]